VLVTKIAGIAGLHPRLPADQLRRERHVRPSLKAKQKEKKFQAKLHSYF
jgi:hypothetical protein